MAAFDISKDKEHFVVSKRKVEKIDGGMREGGNELKTIDKAKV